MTDPTADGPDEETRASAENGALGAAENEASDLEPSGSPVKEGARDPARVATLVVLALCVAFFLL